MACKGCQKRDKAIKDGVKHEDRRGFLWKLAAGATSLAFVTRAQAYQALTGDKVFPYYIMLGFMRTFLTASIAARQKLGRFPTWEETVVSLLLHQKHATPGTTVYLYMNALSFESPEILPDHLIDWFRRLDDRISQSSSFEEEVKGGFVAVLTGPDRVYITDESAIIYCAPLTENAPKAKDLERASDFPGAVIYDKYRDDTALTYPSGHYDRFKARFMNAAYPQGVNCSSQCPGCGCLWCVTNCCEGMSCYNVAFPPSNWCWFTCGGCGCTCIPACESTKCCLFGITTNPTSTGCKWCFNLCALKYFHTCCACPNGPL